MISYIIQLFNYWIIELIIADIILLFHYFIHYFINYWLYYSIIEWAIDYNQLKLIFFN